VVLKGRRLASADGTIAVEFEADEMEWEPSLDFEAELEDGTRVKLKVDHRRSTRTSKVASGALLRLVFEAPARRVIAIEFFSDGVRYQVDL
jgi:hypothetical protein